ARARRGTADDRARLDRAGRRAAVAVERIAVVARLARVDGAVTADLRERGRDGQQHRQKRRDGDEKRGYGRTPPTNFCRYNHVASLRSSIRSPLGTEPGILSEARPEPVNAFFGALARSRAGSAQPNDDEVLLALVPLHVNAAPRLGKVREGVGGRGAPDEARAERRNRKLARPERETVDPDVDLVHAVAEQAPVEEQAEPVVGIAADGLGVAAERSVAGADRGLAVDPDVDGPAVADPSRDHADAALEGAGRGVFEEAEPRRARRLRRRRRSGGGARRACGELPDHEALQALHPLDVDAASGVREVMQRVRAARAAQERGAERRHVEERGREL